MGVTAGKRAGTSMRLSVVRLRLAEYVYVWAYVFVIAVDDGGDNDGDAENEKQGYTSADVTALKCLRYWQ